MPKGLVEEDPTTVLEILIFCSLECGVSQAGLKSQLKEQRKKDLSQPSLSKLLDRIRRAGWIKSARPTKDARERPIKISRAGQKWIAVVQEDFDQILAEAFSTPRARRGKAQENKSAPKSVTLSFFSQEEEQESASVLDLKSAAGDR